MSHFLTMVVLPKSYTPEAYRHDEERVQRLVGRALMPYDENQAVPEYAETCYCVGSEARRRVRELLKDDKPPEVPRPPRGADDATFRAWYEQADRLQEEWQPGHERRVARLMAEQPDRETANPECPECSGSGTYLSTRNPLSQWDWWVIGGRFDGWADPPGTPDRPMTSMSGVLPGPANWLAENNVVKVADLLAREDNNWIGYALLLPDPADDPARRWHQKGQMGWWGVDHDVKPREEWREHVRTVLASYAEQYVVGCDLHI